MGEGLRKELRVCVERSQGHSRKCELCGGGALEMVAGLKGVRRDGSKEVSSRNLGRGQVWRLEWSLQHLHPFFYP